MRHLWTTNKDSTNPKAYVEQSFGEVLCEYEVVYAYNIGFKLIYNGNIANKNVTDLRQIEVQAGYWLCHYDAHSGDWLAMWFKSKPEAKAVYKKLYSRYFRQQEWFWNVKID